MAVRYFEIVAGVFYARFFLPKPSTPLGLYGAWYLWGNPSLISVGNASIKMPTRCLNASNGPPMTPLVNWPRLFLIQLIRLYQMVHLPFFRGSCRFYPTCSQYGIEALQTHGLLKGFYLTVFRVLRCNPFCKGGLDPVPARPCICKEHIHE